MRKRGFAKVVPLITNNKRGIGIGIRKVMTSSICCSNGGIIKDSDKLLVKKLSENAILPVRASLGAAGYDLSSAEDCVIPARGKGLVKTDLAVRVPDMHYGRVAPRSSLAWKNFIDVGAGVIDSDYRGNLGVILFNHSETPFNIRRGDRIAQLVIEKISLPTIVQVDDLETSLRGAGGFGSTGTGSIGSL